MDINIVHIQYGETRAGLIWETHGPTKSDKEAMVNKTGT